MADKGMFIRIAANIDELKKNLADGTATINTTTAAMTKLATSLEGNKLIQNAQNIVAAVQQIGGAAKLTEAEKSRLNATLSRSIEKYQLMGREAPKAMTDLEAATRAVGTTTSKASSIFAGMAGQLAGMFTVGTVVAFGRAVLLAGDNIQKMADQTGMSTVEVQRLNHVAGQSGTSMSSLISAAQNLQQRLGDDNSGAAAAIRKLNINLTAFSALRSYEQMTTLGEALRNIQDPTERASAAAAVFGKNWKEILPAIMAGMQEMGDSATVMSDSTVKALDRAGDSLTAFKNQLIVAGAQIVSGFSAVIDDVKLGLEVFDFARGKVDLLAPAIGRIKPPALDASAGLRDLTLSAAEAARLERELTDSVEESIRVNKAAADTSKKLATETKHLATEVLRFNDLADAESVRGWTNELARVERLAKLDRQALFDMNRELERQIADVHALTLAHADAAANLYLQQELDLYLLQTAALKAQQLVLSDIHNENSLRQMARDAGVTIDALVPKLTKVSDTWIDNVDDLAESFAQLAQITGDSFGGVVQWIGTLTASLELVSKGQQTIGAGWQQMTAKGGSVVAGLTQMAAGAASLAAAFMQATAAGTTLQRTLSGAAVGAQAGSSFGAWGTAIGAGIGALAGWIRGVKAAGQETKDLKASFIEAAGGLTELTRRAAEARVTLEFFFAAGNDKDKLLLAIKGIELGIAAYDKQVRDAAAFTETLATTLDEVAASGRLASRELLEMVSWLEAAGMATEEISKFRLASFTAAATGLNAFFAAWTDGNRAVTISSQATADAFGGALFGVFAGLVKGGQSALEALALLNPSIVSFQEQLKASGLVGSETFRSLSILATVAGDAIAGPALAAIKGLSDALTGLHNSGILNQEMFVGLTNQITQTYQSLIAQGINGKAALQLIQPTLQRIWELQKDFGYEIDGATQGLLDQGIAAGLVGDQHRSASDKILKGIERLVELMEAFLKQMGVDLPAAVSKVVPATRAVEDAFERAADKGVMGFTLVKDTIRALTTEAIVGGSNSLIEAMHELENQMHSAAMSGVSDFAFMAAEIQGMKDQIAQGINIPITLGQMPNVPNAPGGVGGGVGAAGGGGGSASATIRDFLARNPGDHARISSALGIDQATVSSLGFQSGTRNLDFQSFPSRGAFVPLHGAEAVIPKGSGHQLAAEIAAAMPSAFRGAVHDEALQQEVMQLRRTMERRDRTLPHLLATMVADAMATTPRR